MTIVTIIISPAVGDFETSLLVNSLQQAQTNLNRTHTVTAGDATALSDVTVIGDSVALRSSASFQAYFQMLKWMLRLAEALMMLLRFSKMKFQAEHYRKQQFLRWGLIR